MTLDEARAQVGQSVTHHATGTIQDVIEHFVWVRYDSEPTALKSARPEDLTLAGPYDGPAVAYLVHMDGEDYCFDPADVTIVRNAAKPLAPAEPVHEPVDGAR